MLKRVLSSLVGIPLLLLCVFWPGGLPCLLGTMAVSLIALAEFYGACGKQGLRPHSSLGMGAAALALLAPLAASDPSRDRWSAPILTALILLTLTAELLRAERAPVRNGGATLLGALYTGWLFRYLILLRLRGPTLLAAAGGHLAASLPGPVADPGAWTLFLVVAATWSADTAAYFTGRAFGARLLAPCISPGKTVEGSLGGLVGAIVVSALLGTQLLGLPFALSLGLGVLIGVLAPVGDLCESALKREMGIKDFGSLMPGHGGMLDRFDSLLMTAPVVYTVLGWLERGG
jgi:phosphatidate cytidylyltransferase